jgi:hypothetical protein
MAEIPDSIVMVVFVVAMMMMVFVENFWNG